MTEVVRLFRRPAACHQCNKDGDGKFSVCYWRNIGVSSSCGRFIALFLRELGSMAYR